MKEKSKFAAALAVLRTKSGVFWASVIASVLAMGKALFVLLGLDADTEMFGNLGAFLMAIVTVLITAGLIPEKDEEEPLELEEDANKDDKK